MTRLVGEDDTTLRTALPRRLGPRGYGAEAVVTVRLGKLSSAGVKFTTSS